MMFVYLKNNVLRNVEGAGGAGGAADSNAGAGGASGSPPPSLPAWVPPTLPPEVKQFYETYAFGKNETPEAALTHLSQLARLEKEALPKPKGADDAQALDAIYKALGRPEAADKYELKFPDNYTPNEKLVGFARDMAFKLGADGAKAQAMVDGFLAVEREVLASVTGEINATNQSAMAALENEFGAGLAEAKAAGNRALEALKLPPETLAFFDANKGSAHISRVLAAIGKGMGEGSTFSPSNGGGAMNAAQAKQALAEFEKSSTYKEVFDMGPRHPEYKATLEKLEQLGQLAYSSRRA